MRGKLVINSQFRSQAKIQLSFFQILASLQEVFDLTLPPGFQWFVDTIVSWCSLQILSSFVAFECMLDDSQTMYYEVVLIITLTPMFIALVLSGIVTASQMRTDRLRECEGDTEAVEAHNKIKKTCFTVFLWMTYLLVSSVSTTLFNLFPCENFDDGTSRLKASYDISCHGDVYISFEIFGALMILVWPIGVPLFCKCC